MAIKGEHIWSEFDFHFDDNPGFPPALSIPGQAKIFHGNDELGERGPVVY
jgi:hypothetical protein